MNENAVFEIFLKPTQGISIHSDSLHPSVYNCLTQRLINILLNAGFYYKELGLIHQIALMNNNKYIYAVDKLLTKQRKIYNKTDV